MPNWWSRGFAAPQYGHIRDPGVRTDGVVGACRTSTAAIATKMMMTGTRRKRTVRKVPEKPIDNPGDDEAGSLYANVMRSRSGVLETFSVTRAAITCAYRAGGRWSAVVPGNRAGGEGGDQETSGRDVFPTHTVTPIPVCPITMPDQSIVSQEVVRDPESTTGETKNPELT